MGKAGRGRRPCTFQMDHESMLVLEQERLRRLHRGESARSCSLSALVNEAIQWVFTGHAARPRKKGKTA